MSYSTTSPVFKSDVSAHLAAIVSQAARCALFSDSKKASYRHVKIMFSAAEKLAELRARSSYRESNYQEGGSSPR